MTTAVDYERTDPRRLLAVGVLLVINGLLVVGILEKNEVFPFEQSAVDEAADGSVNGATDEDPTTGQTLTTDSSNPDPLNTNSTIPGQTDDEGTETGDIDDWPGGQGSVPTGPPLPRLAALDESGLLVLSGAVPSWATATEIVEVAGAKLPGGIGSVDNQLTWHPDASEQLQSGTVRLDPAVLYPSGSTAVPDEARAGLDLVNGILVANPTVFIVVIGHTDDLGDSEENASVAFARASGVVEYLQSQGSNPAQIVIAAAGEDQPTASNDTEEGRTINRRIEIQFENFLNRESSLG